jgi:hypothetical protein
MNWLGIDPGMHGGIALNCEGTLLVWKMPQTDDDLVNLIEDIQVSYGIDFCVLEEVGARPTQISGPNGSMVNVQGVTQTWNFAQNYGVIRGVLAALKVKRQYVRPQNWQKLLGIPPRRKDPKETQTEWKNRLRAKAQELFPGVKIILEVADAALISEVARRIASSKT